MERAAERAEDRPLLVLISGAPGSGKTTLARRLGDELHLPVVSRDLIKTGMHVTARSEDPAEIHRFAAQAFDLFFGVVEQLLRGGSSVVAEAAFHTDLSMAGSDSPRLARATSSKSSNRC